jgi:hypothetical protein
MTLNGARAKLNRLAEKHGLEIEISHGERGYYEGHRYINAYNDYCIEVIAPDGYAFEADCLHALVQHHEWLEDGYDSLVHQAYDDAAERVEAYLPLEECSRDCDCYCVENRDENGDFVRGRPYRSPTDEEYEARRIENGFTEGTE